MDVQFESTCCSEHDMLSNCLSTITAATAGTFVWLLQMYADIVFQLILQGYDFGKILY